MSEEKTLSVRERILNRKRPSVKVHIPEMESDLIVMAFSVEHMREIAKDPKDLALQLAFMIVDENGEQVFKHTSPGDMQILANMDAAVTTRLFDAAGKINRIGD